MGSKVKIPSVVDLSWRKQFRIIPSKLPPLNFFESLVPPEELETAYYIESLTNDRIRQTVGDIFLVKREDWCMGPGASVVMAAFTHIGKPSRFTDGSHGVYYAAKNIETALEESKYSRGMFLSRTHEEPGEIDMRVYVGKILKPFHDIRTSHYKHLHDPNDYFQSQQFGKIMKEIESWGIVYRSVRFEGGECIAAMRPPAISKPKQGMHLVYVWDGEMITDIYEKRALGV